MGATQSSKKATGSSGNGSNGNGSVAVDDEKRLTGVPEQAMIVVMERHRLQLADVDVIFSLWVDCDQDLNGIILLRPFISALTCRLLRFPLFPLHCH
jgi:hypothetical protein